MQKPNREKIRRDFVAEVCKLAGAKIVPLVIDASSREYFRVKHGNKTYILMDDKLKKNKLPEFVMLASFLANHEVRVPQVLGEDRDKGFLLLEDLGDKTFTKLMGKKDMAELYLLGTDLIASVGQIKVCPPELRELSPDVVVKDMQLFTEWYCSFARGESLGDKAKREFVEIAKELVGMGYVMPNSLVLWDYHVDNLMLLDDGKCAVIDFQDAMCGPAIYDAVSLLEDERANVPQELVEEMKTRYFERFENISRQDFDDAWAFFAMHRHMRVLGRFTTLRICNKKERYMQFVAHAWELLEKTLQYPKLAKMKDWVDAHMPKQARGLPQPKPIDKAFILAAGRGTRMRDLTDTLPKPLIEVNGKALIDYNFDRLEGIGIKDVVVNLCYKGELIREHLKKYPDFKIDYSEEAEALETGGGIKNALHLMGDNAFFVLNSDTFCVDKGYKSMMWKMYEAWQDDKYDILLLFHPLQDIVGDAAIGDYKVDEQGQLVRNINKESDGFPYFFPGLSIVHPRAFAESPDGKFSMRDLYDQAAAKGRLGYVVNEGVFFHVGTPDAIKATEDYLAQDFA